MKKTVSLIQEGEDLILPLDDEIFDALGWKVGDTIKWTDNGDGSWTISRDESALPVSEQSLVYRLRKRAEIRRQIPNRKSVEEGKADRIADLLDEAADEIERLTNENMDN
jgi:bifunctional DNA-binding transcriptional regulator/antitoxin component of YhaV-PrlF toxin-antitoxin module